MISFTVILSALLSKSVLCSIWEGETDELFTLYNATADNEVDRAIEEEWDSVSLIASPGVLPGVVPLQEDFQSRTSSQRGRPIDSCASVTRAVRLARAISARDNIEKKILNNERLSQIEILHICPTTNARCKNLLPENSQVCLAMGKFELRSLNGF